MAANKFATMLLKNTNKFTVILVYTVLEWTLIILLLLNSLFSYLIIKFADYFGLKPPCLWCSRIDHFFEPDKGKNLHRDLLCEDHAAEISKLGYCSNHQKLAAYQNMCEDCSSSRPDFRGVAKNVTFFPWVKEIGMIHNDDDKVVENGEVGLKCCSCCGVSLEHQIYSPYVLINPSNLDDLEYTQKENLIKHHAIRDDVLDRTGSDIMVDHFNDYGFESKIEKQMISSFNGGFDLRTEEVSKFGPGGLEGEQGDKVEMILEKERNFVKEENSSVIMEDLISGEPMMQHFGKERASFPQHLEFFIDFSGQQLVPVELLSSISEENEESPQTSDHQEAHLDTELDIVSQVEAAVVHENKEETKFAVFESMEMEETENSLVFHAKEYNLEYAQVVITQATQTPSVDINEIQDIPAEEGKERESNFPLVPDEVARMQINETEPEASTETETKGQDVQQNVPTVNEEVSQTMTNETEVDVSIGTEIPDLNLTDDTHAQDIVSLHEDPSISCTNHELGSEIKSEEETVPLRSLSIELSDHLINNVEEEKICDTPSSLDSFHHLHKKFLSLERKESGTEESLDGSFMSEFEGNDGVMTVERLTSALKAERKALHVVYSELEEERNASAIAANQTMAMINRLQEEKAAMQMEALQYQRMMEEQSEYDQEALQLLNELMVKREKEKQDLEKELEMYRKKVLDYEAKEKMRLLGRSKDGSARSGFSSASCGDDSDGLSIDLNQESKEENGFYNHQENGNQNTPVDAVLALGGSFGEFEEERMSIIEQLKVLEDKLFSLSEDEHQHFEDVRPIEHYYQENGKHLDEHWDLNGEEVNGVENGYSNSKETNGKHHEEGRIMGVKGKRLLPLFDAITAENENGGLSDGHENGFESAVIRFELEDRRAAIEEEVDQLYARMHALETDKEFLKHCISSLKKGDKGMDLLQEILQHLRDLRNVELRVKNFSDGPLV